MPAFGVTIDDFKRAARRSAACSSTRRVARCSTCGSASRATRATATRRSFTASTTTRRRARRRRRCRSIRAAHYLVVRHMDEAQLVCDYIEGRVDARRIMSTFARAVSPGFDPDVHLRKIGVANQTTMLARESLAIGEEVGAAIARARGDDARATDFRSFDTICSRDAGAAGRRERAARRAGVDADDRHRRLQLEQHDLARGALRRARADVPHRDVVGDRSGARARFTIASRRSSTSRPTRPTGCPTARCASASPPARARRTTRSATSVARVLATRGLRRAACEHVSGLRVATSRSATRCRSTSIRRSTPGEIDVAVALERVPTAGNVAPLGAASLLYQNAEEHWPDELGNDLSSRYPGIELVNLAEDGATIGDVFGEQLHAGRGHRRAGADHAHRRRQRSAERLRQPAASARCSSGSSATSPRRTTFSSITCARRFPNGR